MERLKVLFLCTGNACRSQMAEGWAKALADDVISVQSAGIEVHDKNQQAIDVMTEIGIDISEQEPMLVNGELLEWAELVVTLCDNAEEQCPLVSSQTIRLHFPLPDPTKIKGTDSDIQAEFHETRDKVKQCVEYVADELYPNVNFG